MTSGFALLFLALQAHIKASVPAIRYIDQDLGQLEYYPEGERPAVAWPCLLIDIEATDSRDLGDGIQELDLAIHLRLGFSPFSSANSLTPDLSKEKALQFYEIESDLFVAVQRFDADGMVQPLTRQGGIATEKREDPFRVRVMTFTSTAEEDGARGYHNKVEADLLQEHCIEND
jgi:hypothetical protein